MKIHDNTPNFRDPLQIHKAMELNQIQMQHRNRHFGISLLLTIAAMTLENDARLQVGMPRRCRRFEMALLITVAVITPASSATRAEAAELESIHITSVSVFPAYDIETDEPMGQFVHIHGEVWLLQETLNRINPFLNVPSEFTAKLRIDGDEFSACGTGGNLAPISPTPGEHPRDIPEVYAGSFAIWPLFFLSPNDIDQPSNAALAVGLGRGASFEVAATPMTKSQLLDGKTDASATLLDTRMEHHFDYEAIGRKKQWVQAVQLRLPLGLVRVFGRGAQLACGGQVADWLNISHASEDQIIAFFVKPLKSTKDPWEMRFPDLGVKLKLSKPNGSEE